jgi:hypothetical protein
VTLEFATVQLSIDAFFPSGGTPGNHLLVQISFDRKGLMWGGCRDDKLLVPGSCSETVSVSVVLITISDRSCYRAALFRTLQKETRSVTRAGDWESRNLMGPCVPSTTMILKNVGHRTQSYTYLSLSPSLSLSLSLSLSQRFPPFDARSHLPFDFFPIGPAHWRANDLIW